MPDQAPGRAELIERIRAAAFDPFGLHPISMPKSTVADDWRKVGNDLRAALTDDGVAEREG